MLSGTVQEQKAVCDQDSCLLADALWVLLGGQNVFKGGAGPVQGAPHGAYAPAPYPNNGYPAQPVPGYPAGNNALLLM